MNYSDLCLNVQDTIENTVSAELLALWAQQVEQKVYNLVQLPVLQKTFTGTLSIGNPQLALPPDFLFLSHLAVVEDDGTYTFLTVKETNYIRQVYPKVATTGLPKVYAHFDATTLLLGPTPGAAYGVEIQYDHYPESIVTAGTTWLGDHMDSVLLNGMLVEAARYLKSDKDVVDLYNKMFEESLANLVSLGGKLRKDDYRTPVR